MQAKIEQLSVTHGLGKMDIVLRMRGFRRLDSSLKFRGRGESTRVDERRGRFSCLVDSTYSRFSTR